jgi:hypothetical protein
MRSGEVADFLSSRQLAAAPKSELDGSLTETPRRKTLIETGTFTSMGQQSESMQRRQSHQPGKHERQTATLAYSTGISNNPRPNSSFAYGFPSAATRLQTIITRQS